MPKVSASGFVARAAHAILLCRGQRVILDRDLATIYGVTTKRLNEQVKRNATRFPSDFVFRLTPEETTGLRSQNATLNKGRGRHRKFLPYVFTEHGAIMAATVLSSAVAIEMSIYVVRAFVQLREVLASNEVLTHRLNELETRIEAKLAVHDDAIADLLATIRELLERPPTQRRGIGFAADLDA